MHSRRLVAPLLLALAATTLRTTADAQSSPAILVSDVATGTREHALTANVPLRRGITSTVKIVKDLIDLVPFGMVSIEGGGTISNITNGRTAQGKGFIAMQVAVPSGQAVGTTIRLKVGLHDVFSFRTVHRGAVASLARTPDPSTVTAGTPWVLTINGTDLGAVRLVASFLDCHTITPGPAGATSAQFTLTRGTGCTSQTLFTVALQGTGANDPPNYPLPTGVPASFGFRYFVPLTGLDCATAAGIGAPIIRQPSNGQTLVFAAATASPTNVVIRWDSLTTTTVAAPKNEWIVTARSASSGIALAGSLKTTTQTATVRGLQHTFALALPDTHVVTVRAKNCGESAPQSSVTVRLIRQ